jgi:hypothetical protein
MPSKALHPLPPPSITTANFTGTAPVKKFRGSRQFGSVFRRSSTPKAVYFYDFDVW